MTSELDLERPTDDPSGEAGEKQLQAQRPSHQPEDSEFYVKLPLESQLFRPLCFTLPNESMQGFHTYLFIFFLFSNLINVGAFWYK